MGLSSSLLLLLIQALSREVPAFFGHSFSVLKSYKSRIRSLSLFARSLASTKLEERSFIRSLASTKLEERSFTRSLASKMLKERSLPISNSSAIKRHSIIEIARINRVRVKGKNYRFAHLAFVGVLSRSSLGKTFWGVAIWRRPRPCATLRPFCRAPLWNLCSRDLSLV